MRNWMVGLASSLGIACLLSACVTINIYFPAAAAEKAADKIIDDVWQLKNQDKPTVNTVEPPSTPAPSTPGK
ncbi:MAG TPA: hypothetical protein VK946_05970 [Methylotenera sp.]|nr:hypothetical protein [Methylotenera sp.]